MKKKMLWISGLSLAGLPVSAAACHFTRSSVLLSLVITFGTVFYHLAMRLAVGFGIGARVHNHIDLVSPQLFQNIHYCFTSRI